MEQFFTSTFRWPQRHRTVAGQIGSSFLSAKKDNATILIVEDEAYMLRLLVRFFSSHGYRVLQAVDGEQAIDLYRRRGAEIDTVLLDVRLPKRGGEQVFTEMKTMNPSVKVVMASGYLDPKIRAAMTLAGVKRFIDKPYVLTDVLEIVENTIAFD